MSEYPQSSQIGLISDTHGLLRPEAVAALRGSHLILHAGDVGNPQILSALRDVAPVVAIRGNVDTEPWASSLQDTQLVTASGIGVYILHDVNRLDLSPEAAGISIVLSGHSHKPLQEFRRGVFYINPGSAGPRRFSLPITIARLNLRVQPFHAEIVSLI